ncbi:DUF5803 family protein [Halobium palmae]|uniref:DUF5803 family protein n=1 Tax=Halobium palmae TaxID=1776492 RepID=A0ABD5RXN7_9EURY
MNRKVLAAVALCALALGSGCLGFFQGPQPVDDEQLDAEPPGNYSYEPGYDADRAAYIQVTENARFLAVYEVAPDRSEIRLYRNDGFGGTNAIDVRAVRFRYPNGTVISGSEFSEHNGSVERTRDEVIVAPPTDVEGGNGTVAFTSSSTPKRFSLPAYDWVAGSSYEVVLPPERSVDLPVFGNVRPGGYETAETDGRVHVVWSDLTARSLSVQYYQQRDVYIFAGIALALGLVGVVGLFYYRRQIEELRERREEMGVPVDTDDDEFGDDPPPGMG